MMHFTNWGVIEAPDQRSADVAARRRWLEDGWKSGGYRPMTREQFERTVLADVQ